MMATCMGKEAILAERLRRQRLVEPVKTPDEYAGLFRLLQPVSPVYFTRPGDPPSLVDRPAFDDREITSDWRGAREIVKGRFLRGTIGYVFKEDLGLYANAFQRPMARLSRDQELVYEMLTHTGPLTPRQIKQDRSRIGRVGLPKT